jgi:hypothetical protein
MLSTEQKDRRISPIDGISIMTCKLEIILDLRTL